LIVENGTYYMVGEDKSGGHSFSNVNCYASTDLVQWTLVGAVLTRQASGDLGPNRVVERPKVIYNDRTRKYVLWMHMDSSNYGEARVAVAVGDTVCGRYQYLRSFQPLGRESRDMGLFKDDDGKGYLLTEDVRLPPLCLGMGLTLPSESTASASWPSLTTSRLLRLTCSRGSWKVEIVSRHLR
jgi:hypothetical protein